MTSDAKETREVYTNDVEIETNTTAGGNDLVIDTGRSFASIALMFHF